MYSFTHTDLFNMAVHEFLKSKCNQMEKQNPRVAMKLLTTARIITDDIIWLICGNTAFTFYELKSYINISEGE